MKGRWATIGFALLAATAFAVSVQGGRWWSLGGIEIGPSGARRCFDGECSPIGLGWIGAGERWMRFGVATWAAGLVAMFVFVVLAAGVAAKRVPKLAAKTAVVALVTAAIAGGVFFVQLPTEHLAGASVDRGVWMFVVAIALGTVAAIIVLRAPRPEPTKI